MGREMGRTAPDMVAAVGLIYGVGGDDKRALTGEGGYGLAADVRTCTLSLIHI